MTSRYSAPKVWKRPYNHIYKDNYRYGNSLYSDEISNIERKYNESMARTSFRSDRPDLNFKSFSDSQLTGESIIQRQRAAAAAQATLDTDRFRSPPAPRIRSDDRITRRLQHSDSFDTYSRTLANINTDLEGLRRSQSFRRPQSLWVPSTAFEESLVTKNDGKEDKTSTTERWYRNSMRSVGYNLYPTHLLRALLV